MKTRPHKLTKVKLRDRWSQIMTTYRRKHRQWVMENMPSMPHDQWKQYERWVTDFGAATVEQSGRHARKVRRQLRAAKESPSKPMSATQIGNAISRMSLMGSIKAGEKVHFILDEAASIPSRALDKLSVTRTMGGRATRRSLEDARRWRWDDT